MDSKQLKVKITVTVQLDKNLIYRLVSFIALRSCTETVILTFNRLESIEVHYMEIIRGTFSSKKKKFD